MTTSSTKFTQAQNEIYDAGSHFANSAVAGAKTLASWGFLGGLAYTIGAYSSVLTAFASASNAPLTVAVLAPSLILELI
jgi:hypothetical protein